MAKVALFPGSFDPMTNGHLDVLRAALDLADRVVIVIGVHPSKQPYFPTEERVRMLSEVVAELPADARHRVKVISFDGLITDAALQEGATVIVRGIRDLSDADFELRMAAMNEVTAPGIRTVFVAASPMHRHISATLIRQIGEMRGDPAPFVPAPVARRFRR